MAGRTQRSLLKRTATDRSQVRRAQMGYPSSWEEFTLAPANPQTPSISDRDGRLHPRRLHQPPTSQPSTTPVLFSPRDAHCRKCNKQPFHLHYIASCLTSHLNCLTMRRDALGDRNIKIKKRHVQKLARWHGERKSLNNHRWAVVY